MRPDRQLAGVARVVEQVRTARMLAGDAAQAARLAQIVDALNVEAEVLDGIVVRGFISPPQLPARRNPPRALGWWLRHDQVVRAVRRSRGFTVPELEQAEAAA